MRLRAALPAVPHAVRRLLSGRVQGASAESNPTARALGMSPITVLVAPFRTATLREQEETARMALSEIEAGRVPIFLPWALGGLLSDEVLEQRARALAASESFTTAVARAGGRCLVLEGRCTEGMKGDLVAWRAGGGAQSSMSYWTWRLSGRGL